MKTHLLTIVRAVALAAAALSASCSTSLYDVRYADNNRSATGLVRRELPDPETIPVSHVGSDSEGPGIYLLFVNLLRAPFIPVIGALELASPLAAGMGSPGAATSGMGSCSGH